MIIEKNIKHDPEILRSLLYAFNFTEIDKIIKKIISKTTDYKELNDEIFSNEITQNTELKYVLKAYKRALDNINEFY